MQSVVDSMLHESLLIKIGVHSSYFLSFKVREAALSKFWM